MNKATKKQMTAIALALIMILTCIPFSRAEAAGGWIYVSPKDGLYTIYVEKGKDVLLEVEVEVGGEYTEEQLSFQWSKYDSSTEEFVDIPGAKEKTYLAQNVTKDITTYQCIVKVPDEAEASTYMHVQAKEGDYLELTAKDGYFDQTKGDQITLECVKQTNVQGEVTYQWYKALNEEGPYEPISGETGLTYTMTVNGSRYYKCVATSLDQKLVREAVIIVKDAEDTDLSVNLKEYSNSVEYGTKVQLEAEVYPTNYTEEQSKEFTYQWYKGKESWDEQGNYNCQYEK